MPLQLAALTLVSLLAAPAAQPDEPRALYDTRGRSGLIALDPSTSDIYVHVVDEERDARNSRLIKLTLAAGSAAKQWEVKLANTVPGRLSVDTPSHRLVLLHGDGKDRHGFLQVLDSATGAAVKLAGGKKYETGKGARTVSAHFLRDGRLLAIEQVDQRDGTVRSSWALHDAQGKRSAGTAELRALDAHVAGAANVARNFSLAADGRIVVASGSELSLWSADLQKKLRAWPIDDLGGVTVTPDAKWALTRWATPPKRQKRSASGISTAAAWIVEIDGAGPPVKVQPPNCEDGRIGYAGDGAVVAWTGETGIRIWDKTGKVIGALDQHGKEEELRNSYPHVDPDKLLFLDKGVVEELAFDAIKPYPGQVLVPAEALDCSYVHETFRYYDWQNFGTRANARLEMRQGRWNAALAQAMRLVHFDHEFRGSKDTPAVEGTGEGYVIMGRALARLGDHRGAVRAYRAALDRVAESSENIGWSDEGAAEFFVMPLWLAEEERLAGLAPAAAERETAFAQTLAGVTPGLPRVIAASGLALIGRKPEALAAAAQAKRELATDWKALKRIGEIQIAAGDEAAGIATLREAQALAPAETTLALRLAYALMARKEYAGARAALATILGPEATRTELSLDSKTVPLYAAEGVAWYLEGSAPGARKDPLLATAKAHFDVLLDAVLKLDEPALRDAIDAVYAKEPRTRIRVWKGRIDAVPDAERPESAATDIDLVRRLAAAYADAGDTDGAKKANARLEELRRGS